MQPTLLLADDSVTIQRVIELTFADERVRVVSVGNGGEAIALLDRTPPDIVLADVGMPGPNGYDIARHIKETPSLAHIPIVLLTGVLEPIDQARVAEIGCDGVVAKPFEPQVVVATVRELLARGTGADNSASSSTPAVPPEGELPRDSPVPADRSYLDRLDIALSNLVTERAARAPRTTESASAAMAAARAAAGAHVLTPLGEAFAAFLEEERTAPVPAAPPVWPVGPLVPVETSCRVAPEDVAEQVARRVLDQLSDRVVRELAAPIVSAVAERLIREEIEKIKASVAGPGDGVME